MGANSKIEWTDATWNPWYGCHKISPGCAYCYMDRWANRSGRDPEKITRAKDASFYAPLKWKKPRRIFTCSLSDCFIEEADEWRWETWDVIAKTPHHTYLILTKRVERVHDLIPWHWSEEEIKTHNVLFKGVLRFEMPWPNVWLGVSVENQRQADERIPQLLKIPAAKRFVSIEPLLEAITLDTGLRGGPPRYLSIETDHSKDTRLDWVIVGGESGGPEHRRLVHGQNAMHLSGICDNNNLHPKPEALQWVRSLRDQCQAAGVKFFFKQFGGPRPESGGRILDGRTWDEIPDAI